MMKKFLLVAVMLFSANTWCAETRDGLTDKQKEFVGVMSLRKACREVWTNNTTEVDDAFDVPHYGCYRTQQGMTMDVVWHVDVDNPEEEDEKFPLFVATRWGQTSIRGSLPLGVDSVDIERHKREFISRLMLTKLGSFLIPFDGKKWCGTSYRVDAVDNIELPIFNAYNVEDEFMRPLCGSGPGTFYHREKLRKHDEIEAWNSNVREWQNLKKWYNNKYLETES